MCVDCLKFALLDYESITNIYEMYVVICFKSRIGVMSQSIKIYIETYARNNTALGIVAFSNYATALTQMTEITTSAVRSSLSAAVPNAANGGTNIGAGLETCQMVS